MGTNCNNNNSNGFNSIFAWLCGCCCFIVLIIIFLIGILVLWYTFSKPAMAVATTAAPVAYVAAAPSMYPQYQFQPAHVIPPPTLPNYAATATNPWMTTAAAATTASSGTAIYQANTLSGGVKHVNQLSCGQVVKGGHINGGNCIICGCDVISGFDNCCPATVEIRSENLGTTKVDGCARSGC